MLHSRALLFTYFIYSSVYLLISNFKVFSPSLEMTLDDDLAWSLVPGVSWRVGVPGVEGEGWSLLLVLRGVWGGGRTWPLPGSSLVSCVFWGKSVNFSEVWKMEMIMVTPSGHDGVKRDSL